MVKNLATSGTLYIVATPIGNLNDITFRAIDILKSVDAVLAEDTRHSVQLLKHWGIQKPLYSLHDFNESTKITSVISFLEQGKSYALISDAGTPLISDPGYLVVHTAREKKIAVVPIPGPCALITALSAAGVSCERFTFAGFLPAKKTARETELTHLRSLQHTVVVYESTHRIIECLESIHVIYGESYEVVLAKELTKTFENFIKNTALEIKRLFISDPLLQKGEFVIILPALPIDNTENNKAILSILLQELPLKQAVKIGALITKAAKNDLYQMALQIQTDVKK